MSAAHDVWLSLEPQPVKTPAELAAGAKVCAKQGHDDLDRTPGVRRSYPMVECQRCGRVGWRAPA